MAKKLNGSPVCPSICLKINTYLSGLSWANLLSVHHGAEGRLSVGGYTTWVVTHSRHPAELENWCLWRTCCEDSIHSSSAEECWLTSAKGSILDTALASVIHLRLKLVEVGDVHGARFGWRALGAAGPQVLKRLAAWLAGWLAGCPLADSSAKCYYTGVTTALCSKTGLQHSLETRKQKQFAMISTQRAL